MDNYVVYHCHSDLSSAVTNIDSTTKFTQYVDRAKECGMKALAFSEHGSVFEWVKKKETIEQAGMKYIHASEFYITSTLEEKIRDNNHCVLIAKNYAGVREINKLSTISFNRDDNHMYYNPRISIDELVNTSDNIIVTTACLATVLRDENKEYKKKYLQFLVNNKHRCYLEIQHHNVPAQIEYNQYLYKISQKFGIPLIAGTDTHSLDEVYAESRVVLQKAKKINFGDEDGWDLSFKSRTELEDAYRKQGALPEGAWQQAIDNTVLLADQIEEFELDRSYKYPHLWENSEELFKQKIKEGIIRRGINKYPNYDEYKKRIKEEFAVYKQCGSIDFMLLMEDVISYCHDNDIATGYGRGSVNGSVIAWLLGITEMDSIKHKLFFSRFMNPERISLAD